MTFLPEKKIELLERKNAEAQQQDLTLLLA